MQTIAVSLESRSYNISIVHELATFANFYAHLYPKRPRCVVLADSNTAALAEQLLPFLPESHLLTVPAGESSKSLAVAGDLYSQLARLRVDRATPLIAVGGGVVGDLGGFLAATFNRGLPLLMVPTSLLSMVDSSVGGKVGINLPEGKNLVGAFYQPKGVWINTQFLDHLPEREYCSGLAEVVKYGVILDATFFVWLEQNIDAILARDPAAVEHLIAVSCRCKADVVEQDEREETGLRMVLNYGHTFAHAFESLGAIRVGCTEKPLQRG
ncbi:MAG: 3-dehydroquinate synthase family protein [Zavarzinella sp.]